MSNFPPDFYWGAATSSHQVEGNSANDWSEWETAKDRLAALKSSGQIAKHGYKNFVSGRACDHYNYFREDFTLAKRLGHNATRLSIEWSRIEPDEGKINPVEIEHYRKVVLFLRETGIEPFVTLWHWPIPLWLRDKGGWVNRKAADYFARYCQAVVEALSPYVKFWITLNEPEVYAANSYIAGIWPPQLRNPYAYMRVFHNLIAAHRLAYDAIKRLDSKSQIGIANANIYYVPYENRLTNKTITKVTDWWWNFYFLNRIKEYQDFIGLNQYMRCVLNYGFLANENASVSDMGWELFPEGIYHVLCDLGRYNKPIYVTENGLADAKDTRRGWFIVENIRNVQRAITEGVVVKGYLHWSLMDNFEWDKGFWPRFGLVEINYDTLERRPRPSAMLYADICRANGITNELIAKHNLDLRETGNRSHLY